jgi:extradiol dioxygenase family protein
MHPQFHLSIGVNSLRESVDFFVHLLRAKITHEDPSGYVNLDFYGSQITLKEHPGIQPELPHFHFGANLALPEFEKLAAHILAHGEKFISMTPQVWDAGTPLERKKMYLKCPTGYVVELKGYA